MKRLVILVLSLAVLAALSGCTAGGVSSNEPVPSRTVTASGTGITAAAPDVAEMYLGVTILEKDAKTALDTASKTATAITAAVKDAGVPAEDIQTANISVYPQYSNSMGTTSEITGYSASIQVRVKVRELAKIGDVITRANDAGANEVGGPTFTLSDDSEARAKSIKLAVDDARKKAQIMAEAAGKSVGEVVSISETGVQVPVIAYEAASVRDSSVPIEPGQLDVTANVTVVFRLK